MKKNGLLAVIGVICFFTVKAQHNEITSTYSTVRNLMEHSIPKLSYNTSFTPEQIQGWQNDVTATMEQLMRHPSSEFSPPVLVKCVKRPGYTVEKWNSYPIEGSVVPFLVLIPDGVDQNNPAPAVLCIPGWGQSKELLAGERLGNYSLEGAPDSIVSTKNMARHMVENGFIALAIDNPSCGELSDNGNFDYLLTSRFLLENGWSYLGLSSWQDRVALHHLMNRNDVNNEKIVVSGFSLGTEPLMVLGALEPQIYAFVYNDILVRTRERILVTDKVDDKGLRRFPNTEEHLIPGFLNYFDFPDLVANLAPRHVICTEGGMERDFEYIADAYEKTGAPDNFQLIEHYHNYPDYVRQDTIPNGIDLAQFYTYLGVSPSHYYKVNEVIPWLKQILK